MIYNQKFWIFFLTLPQLQLGCFVMIYLTITTFHLLNSFSVFTEPVSQIYEKEKICNHQLGHNFQIDGIFAQVDNGQNKIKIQNCVQIYKLMIQVASGVGNQTLVEVPLQKAHIDPTTDFALLHYLRIVFYVFIAIKLIEIVFMRRRKLKISERIQRKFLFAHGIDMIKNFSAEQFQLMNLTLQNTLKNAIQPLSNGLKKSNSKVRKSVSFLVESNVYYDHPQSKVVSSESIPRPPQPEPQPSPIVIQAQKKIEQQSSPLIEIKQQSNQSE